MKVLACPVRRCLSQWSASALACFAAMRATAAALVAALPPARLVFGGYLLYVLAGWLLLCLPLAHRPPRGGALDHLFTAASAVSTTGLVTISASGDYTFFGQCVILFLIQLGGVGYMTVGSFIILARRPELSETRIKAGRAVFSLPESFQLAEFIRGVAFFTIVIETAGALALYPMLREAGVPDPGWSAIFHAVSAFCTAGFSLYDDSLSAFASHAGMHLVVGALSLLGAVGFIVCTDFWNYWRGRTQGVTLTSKIILGATSWLLAGGTLLLFLAEPSLAAKPADERLLAAFFQAMTALTTVGFNTVDIAGLSKASALLLIALMVVGASPSGTGGGVKATTFSAIFGVIRSSVRGEHEVRFWGRPIPLERIWSAVASFGFYLAALATGLYLLELTEAAPFEQLFFEAASALGTVGLSMGVTPHLTSMGKIIVILLMFMGRLGPLTFGAALFMRRCKDESDEVRDSDLAV